MKGWNYHRNDSDEGSGGGEVENDVKALITDGFTKPTASKKIRQNLLRISKADKVKKSLKGFVTKEFLEQ